MIAHYFYIQDILINCIDCNICVKECGFLQENGTPREIGDTWCEDRGAGSKLCFECNLCGLCTAVCPKRLDPQAMFLTMRRVAVELGLGEFEQHNTILNYERRGRSDRFSHCYLPEGCDTVLFPGCALPGTRPDTLKELFLLVRRKIPNLGIVLDCCTKPTHDLGRDKQFHRYFRELLDITRQYALKKILVACPNCYRIFSKYGEGLEIVTVYELLNRKSYADILPIIDKGRVAVHDACSTRFNSGIQDDTRDLLGKMGIELKEMKHRRHTTFCCGEGGSVPFLRPDLAKEWSNKRVNETDYYRMVTYCAGCTHLLRKVGQTDHLLDLIFFPQKTMSGKIKASISPITYTNRWAVKRWLETRFSDGVSGTRRQLLHR